MSQPQANNPLTASEPCNFVADGYAETTMRVFEQFADAAIVASKLKPNSTVPDVACEPGAADFGCAVEGGGEMMTAKKLRSAPVGSTRA